MKTRGYQVILRNNVGQPPLKQTKPSNRRTGRIHVTGLCREKGPKRWSRGFLEIKTKSCWFNLRCSCSKLNCTPSKKKKNLRTTHCAAFKNYKRIQRNTNTQTISVPFFAFPWELLKARKDNSTTHLYIEFRSCLEFTHRTRPNKNSKTQTYLRLLLRNQLPIKKSLSSYILLKLLYQNTHIGTQSIPPSRDSIKLKLVLRIQWHFPSAGNTPVDVERPPARTSPHLAPRTEAKPSHVQRLSWFTELPSRSKLPLQFFHIP